MSKEILKIIAIKDIIDSPWQGRLINPDMGENNPDMGEIRVLSDSIKKNGLMQPITVRIEGKKYELIDGHRRVLACKMAGFGNIKSIIKNYNDQQAQLFSLIGNLQRKNLNAIEQAFAFQKVLNDKMFLSNKELSRAIGKDETYVGDVLNTLKMDKRIIEDISNNDTLRDVRLLRLIRKMEPADENRHSNKQWQLYQKVIKEKLSRKQVQELLQQQRLQGKNALKAQKWHLKPGKTHIGVKLNTGKLNSVKQEKIIRLLEKKLEELMKEL